VSFVLRPSDDLSYFDEGLAALTVDPGEYEIRVGASSQDIRQRMRVTIK
jgi:beta-glucosidase